MKMNRKILVGLTAICLLLSGCSNTSSQISEEPITFKIASINDLHGSIENVGEEPGLSKLTTYLKDNYDDNDLLLANGDMWQGNGESNLNHGRLVTEWMNSVDFDCMAIGNHDFDWGVDAIKENRAVADFPFISSNIYNYADGAVKGHCDDLADLSAVLTVGSYKVGVIGAIGREQYTSITSSLVSDIDFVDPYSIIKSEAVRLRTEEDCSAVIAEIHAPQEDGNVLSSGMQGLAETDSTTKKKYVDAVFCGHSHNNKSFYYNGVPYIRATAYGKAISDVEITINPDKTVNVDNYGYHNINQASLTTDPATETLLNRYRAAQDPILDVKLGKNHDLTSTFMDTESLANLNAKVNYEAVVSAGYTDVDISVVNTARNSLDSGEVTFRDVYRSFPFDNKIVIMTVSSADLYNETVVYSNYIYNPHHIAAPSYGGTKTYKIAVIDYVGLHQNASHEYNYFPSMSDTQILSGDDYLPRILVKNYLNTLTYLSYSDYQSASADFSY